MKNIELIDIGPLRDIELQLSNIKWFARALSTSYNQNDYKKFILVVTTFKQELKAFQQNCKKHDK